jgi:hypothetical protein
VRAFWSRQLTCMEVLGCGSVRLRVFLQGLGITSSLNTSLIIAFICVMEVGDWTAAQLAPLRESGCIHISSVTPWSLLDCNRQNNVTSGGVWPLDPQFTTASATRDPLHTMYFGTIE